VHAIIPASYCRLLMRLGIACIVKSILWHDYLISYLPSRCQCLLVSGMVSSWFVFYVDHAPTPAGPVRWRRDQHGTKIFCNFTSGSHFLGQTMIRLGKFCLDLIRQCKSTSHGSILSRKGSPEKMRLQERLEGEEVSAALKWCCNWKSTLTIRWNTSPWLM
jgi:hypothetical protein